MAGRWLQSINRAGRQRFLASYTFPVSFIVVFVHIHIPIIATIVGFNPPSREVALSLLRSSMTTMVITKMNRSIVFYLNLC